MFRSLIRNQKGQNTAEYALLIALVVAGIIAMQQYAQRALQARVKDASSYLTSTKLDNSITNGSFTTAQYEPYYKNEDYTIARNSEDSKRLDTNVVMANASTNRERTGASTTTYDNTQTVY